MYVIPKMVGLARPKMAELAIGPIIGTLTIGRLIMSDDVVTISGLADFIRESDQIVEGVWYEMCVPFTRLNNGSVIIDDNAIEIRRRSPWRLS